MRRDARLPRGEIGEIWIHGRLSHQGILEQSQGPAENFTGGFWHLPATSLIDVDNLVRCSTARKT